MKDDMALSSDSGLSYKKLKKYMFTVPVFATPVKSVYGGQPMHYATVA